DFVKPGNVKPIVRWRVAYVVFKMVFLPIFLKFQVILMNILSDSQESLPAVKFPSRFFFGEKHIANCISFSVGGVILPQPQVNDPILISRPICLPYLWLEALFLLLALLDQLLPFLV